MWFFHLVLALIIAVLLTAVFGGVSRGRGWRLAWVFFLLIFLGSWAGGIWVRPFGPPFYEVYWMPSLGVGVIIALLLVTLLPAPTPPDAADSASSVDLVEAQRRELAGSFVLGFFFWLLLAVLVISIVAGYFLP